MKAKKWIAGLLTAVMLLSLTGNFALAAAVSAPQDGGAGGYHYDQLTDLAKTVYDGISALGEGLKTGTAEYDLVGHGLDGSALPGSAALNQAMNAARYAYYADHPEVFYVDFPKLTLRTTQDQAGNKHVYIGSGRNASYLTGAFAGTAEVEAAIAEFDARVDAIVAGAKAVTDKKGDSLQAAQIEYVHDEIIDHVSYRLEDTAAFGNAPLLGTPYGVLVKKQGVCEGYARAFKTVLDRLGINCILVQGVHQYDGEAAVGHMWNAVEITDADSAARAAGGRWYAVDATLDDPEIPVTNTTTEYSNYHNHFDTYGLDNFEQKKYLLAGQLTMNGKHFEAEEVEAAGGYHFDYPVLEDNDFTVTSISNDLDGFEVIKQDVPGAASGETVTEFKFNYLGMTATEAKEKGIYLVWRYYREDENSGEIAPVYNVYGSWFYLNPDGYSLKEENGYVCIQEGSTPYVEIAATTVPPETNPPADKPFAELTYQGDDSGLIARTGMILNPNVTNYIAPPYIVRQTPTQTATINNTGRSYHVTAEFDEALALAEGYTLDTVKTRIECRDRYGAGVSGDTNSLITNLHWDEDRTVEFDIKFSLMYADSNVIYNIYLEGLVGENSKKTPNPITYTTRRKGPCPCIMERDGNWDVFGKPTLLEGEDLSMTGWETSNGQPVSDLLSHRLVLVTTSTTEAQDEQIAEQVEANVDEKIIKSETYNVGLSVCKSMVIKTGNKLKVRLGFPAGYGPDDEGVTFKAYHFPRDNQGNVTGVEEIECIVTQYGLILLCDAFSPFMVAVVEQDPAAAEDKTVVVTASDGGTVTGTGLPASGIVKLQEGGSQSVTFTAKDGYQIDSLTVCGKEIAVTDSEKKTASVTINYADVLGANVVNANFVAATVAQKEEEKGETPVKLAEQAYITNMPASKTVTEGDTLTIEPTVISQAGSVKTFQWYKNGTALEGKTGKNLEISNVTAADAGAYSFKVTVTVGDQSEEIQSSPCTVTVMPKCTITGMPASRALTEGDTLTIEPTVTGPAEGVSFQWYKDGAALEGKTGKDLEIQNVTAADAGAYTLKVTVTVGTLSAESQSDACIVTVTPKSTGGNTGGGSTGGGTGGSGTGGTKTETVTNPDGSRTTTVTNKTTGTVTATTKYQDGATLVVETKKDGTKTTTSTAKNGVIVKTVDAPDQAVTASVTLPKDVATAVVTIPAATAPGLVAVDAATGEVVKLSVPTQDGVLVKLDASAQLVLADRAKDFTDSAGHWAQEAIDFASAHGLFSGTGEASFSPEDTMTRAMLMTVLARFDGEDTAGGSTWYEKGLSWAVANGVSDGSAPESPITREQLATALWRYAGSPTATGSLEQYADADSVSGYAVDALRWAVSTGLLSGMDNSTLAPGNSATRAQVATILMRYVGNLTRDQAA